MKEDLKIFADTIEDSAREQVNDLIEVGVFSGSKIRIMPDVHSGKGCVIGFTAELGEKIIPEVVGVDIGCGVRVYEFPEKPDSKHLQEIIQSYIPSGGGCIREDWKNIKPAYKKYREKASVLVEKLKCKSELRNLGRLADSVGSLGSGNHYLELNYSEKTNSYFLVIHSGSRNLGKQVAEIYQNLAIKTLSRNTKEDYKRESEEFISSFKKAGKEKELRQALRKFKEEFKQRKPKIPQDLCWLEGENMNSYLHDMSVCQEFAVLNRELIGFIILDKLGINPVNTFETIHNYINMRDRIVRKGSISAYSGEKIIIPMNMRDGSLICIGKGNPDWNFSAPHGAGRLMSRSKAKDNITLEEFKETMSGIDTWSVSESTIDEAPQAYKSMNEIISLIEPTVEIIDIIKPIFNFKAS